MGDGIFAEDYKYEENLIKLEVYYEEFNFEQIDERPSYPVRHCIQRIVRTLVDFCQCIIKGIEKYIMLPIIWHDDIIQQGMMNTGRERTIA